MINGEGSKATGGAGRGPVNALIAYGTTRGTTAKIGEAIADGMASAGATANAIHFDLLSMMPNRVLTADVLGIGAPVYFLREAAYVADFISSLPPLEGKRAFAYCASGMDRVGETLARLQMHLSERGAIVVGAKHFQSAMSYAPYRKRGLGNPAHLPDGAVLTVAREFGERMARADDLDPIPLRPVPLATRLKARLLANRAFRRVVLPGIRLKRDTCTGYGSCISRCPFGGLEREDDEAVPIVTDSCIQCLQCVDFCPRAAIEIDSQLKERFSSLGYRLGLH